jgi:hypothetical protein
VNAEITECGFLIVSASDPSEAPKLYKWARENIDTDGLKMKIGISLPDRMIFRAEVGVAPEILRKV